MTLKSNKTKFILGITAVVVLTTLLMTSNTLTTATAQTTTTVPTSQCPPGDQVQHWDKIVFQINSFRNGDNDGKQQTIGSIPASYMGTDLDLKIADQPGVVANLKQEIVNSFASQFTLTTQQQTTLYNDIKITSDNYETVNCGMTGPQGPPGPQGPTGATGPQGPAGTGGGSSTGSTNSPTDTFLTIYNTDGTTIDGESTDSKHTNAIEILSYGFSTENAISIGSGTSGAGAGKEKFNAFTITKKFDKTSPILFTDQAIGKHFDKVVLTVRKAGGTQDFLTITLGTVLVSEITHASNGDYPTETISFFYGTLQEDYKPQNPDGTLGSNVHAFWNEITNSDQPSP